MTATIISPPPTRTQSRWEHFPHQADVGVRGIGPTLENAFEQAAVASMAVITDPSTIRAQELVEVNCEADDDEVLFADWLDAIIYEVARHHMLFSKFEVEMSNHHLHGKMWGEKVDIERHQPAVEIKGATYTELRVHKRGDEWIAQCVLDV